MPSFQVINNIFDIKLEEGYYEKSEFKSKDWIVNELGCSVGAEFKETKYKMVFKQQSEYGILERIGRISIGILALVFTAGIVCYYSKNVYKLFKSKDSVRFGVKIIDKRDQIAGLTDLNFGIPVLLTATQTDQLKIFSDGRVSNRCISNLSRYADSLFDIDRSYNGLSYVITRRKKFFNGVPLAIPQLLGLKDAQSDEGMKVRTFCFELFSNIADLEMSKRDPLTKKPLKTSDENALIKLEEIQDFIRYFLHKGALEEKAGFYDYSNFLGILERGAHQFSSIFKRHFDLLDLQGKLSKGLQKKVRCWDKIRTAVKAGLFTHSLMNTAKAAKSIGLCPLPQLPKKETIVNLYPTIDAINMVTNEYREAGRWLMHHTRVITFRELCQSIKKSCEQIRDTILTWDDYYIVKIKRTSQAWMADIGYRFLPPEKMAKGVVVVDNLCDIIERSESRNYIVFDDGAYSARQLADQLWNFKSCKRMREKNVYFIYGHFPKDKYKKFNFDMSNLSVRVISNNLLESCKYYIEKEKVDSSLKQKIESLTCIDRPLAVTEWKRPDFMSTSVFITRGNAAARQVPYRLEYGGSVESRDSLGPITNVKPPYDSMVYSPNLWV